MKIRRPNGRPCLGDQTRTKFVRFRANQEEINEIERVADEHGMSVSEFIRASLKTAMEENSDE